MPALMPATRTVPIVFVQFLIPSAPVLSQAWRGQVEMQPVLLNSILA
jgi:hypothetical protein